MYPHSSNSYEIFFFRNEVRLVFFFLAHGPLQIKWLQQTFTRGYGLLFVLDVT